MGKRYNTRTVEDVSMFFKEFPLPTEPKIPSFSVKITDFGAKENQLCTDAIDAAFDCVASHGGGRVVVPAGEWLCGRICLRSNTELHFEDGAHVTFSTSPEHYLPAVFTVYEGIRCYNYSPLIYGKDLCNVAITGRGILEGGGEFWWTWAKNLTARDILYSGVLPLEKRIFATPEYGLRPMFLQIINSDNVLIEGITLNNSPCWTVHPVWCRNVIVRGVTIENPTVSPNTDGVNIESCNRALVEDCTVVTTGDDMFCLKAGRNEDAWEVGIPCENVVIRNCRSLGKSTSGGVVIGSEMSAGVRNVLAHDCHFADNVNCIRLKAKDGRGGVVENISFRNISLERGDRGINLSFRYSCEANDAPKEPGKHMPAFRNISFSSIKCDNVGIGISLHGVEGGEMSGIYFKDIDMSGETCMTSDSVDGIFMERVHLRQITK